MQQTRWVQREGCSYVGRKLAPCRMMASQPAPGLSLPHPDAIERARNPKFPSQADFARKGAKLSIEEALYLAKEAGYYTTREQQLQIIRSPPFSARDRPFLLENYFEVADYDDDGQTLEEETAVEIDKDTLEGVSDMTHPVIHGTLKKHFCPDEPSKFWHGGQEWLSEAEGHGTRKRAAAHALIKRGSGLFKVNGESDVYSYWTLLYNRFDVCQPFKLTGTACAFDVFVEVRGGGPGGQAGATRLAVSRALLMANPACHDDLQRGFCLLEDTRQKMSKMPGKAKRTASYAWSRR